MSLLFNKNYVDKILKAIFPLPECFGLICDDYDDELEDYDFIKKEIQKIDPGAEVRFGMSKLVIIPSIEKNIVIKIPFNGVYNYEEPYDDEDYYTEGEYIWKSFCYAPGSDKTDYCLAECEKYQKLKSYGLHCFVAKTILYKVYEGIRIFIQEKGIPETDACSNHTASLDSQKLAKELRNEGKFHYIRTEWIANCLDKYKEFKVKKFLEYCSKDPDILADMHDDNFGYRKNGTPVLLDFSNYLD